MHAYITSSHETNISTLPKATLKPAFPPKNPQLSKLRHKLTKLYNSPNCTNCQIAQVTATLSKDGGVEGMEINGQMSLEVRDASAACLVVKLSQVSLFYIFVKFDTILENFFVWVGPFYFSFSYDHSFIFCL